MKHSIQTISYIKQLKEDLEYSWEDIAQMTNAELGTKLTANAAKKLYQNSNRRDVDLIKEEYKWNLKNKVLKQTNKKLTSSLLTQSEFLEKFQETLQNSPLTIHKPTTNKENKAKFDRTVVGHLSDTHYGTNIEKNEVNGVNEFNWTIAARRTAFFIDQLVKYKPEHRKETDLVLLLNGDMIGGIIHNQEHFVDLMTTQFSGALSILIQGISYLAGHYKKVRVVGTAGNHGRSMHKSDKGRATTHKWDNYETMIYIALKQALVKHTNVEVIYEEAPFIILNIQGHKNLITHSDTVVSVGNVGSNLNIKRIKEQINDFNVNLPRKERIGAVFCGHVHVPLTTQLDSGTFIFVNGNLSGIDPYAQSLGIGLTHSKAVQQIIEITPQFYGDVRFVQTQFGDGDSSLDKIISPFKGKILK